jgi:hypothetical protein
MKIPTDHPDFSVRLAGIDDLLRINEEARANGWTARWSSPAALRRQVDPASTAIICPLLRNGRGESLRCHVWFVADRPKGVVSLLDVGKGTLLGLREAATPRDLRQVARILLDSYDLVAIE